MGVWDSRGNSDSGVGVVTLEEKIQWVLADWQMLTEQQRTYLQDDLRGLVNEALEMAKGCVVPDSERESFITAIHRIDSLKLKP